MNVKQLSFLTALGSGLEYYDFVIYALAAPYISLTFFPSTQGSLAFLQTLLIFATGYLFRPLGGMIFGSLGDRVGRKSSFTLAILLMAISTVSIAIFPGFSSWGWLSPALLMVARGLQGIAQGAELPGALTFIAEHAENKNRGYYSGILFMGVGLGTLLASLVFLALHHFLSPLQLQTHGWRWPFLFGGLLACFAYVLRKRARETPAFLSLNQKSINPLRDVIKFHHQSILCGIGLIWFPGSFIIYFLFLPAFLHDYFQYPLEAVLLTCSIGTAWSSITLPLWGRISDRLGQHRLFQLSVAITLLVLPCIFYLISQKNFTALIVALLLYQTTIGAMASCYPLLLARLFPTRIRYSGTALSYNIAFTLAGASPMIIAGLLNYRPQPSTTLFYFITIALLSFLTSFHPAFKKSDQTLTISREG